MTRNDRIYDIAGINGRVGGSDLEGALKVDTSRNNRPYLTGDLRSRRLDFKDLGSLFGATSANAPQGRGDFGDTRPRRPPRAACCLTRRWISNVFVAWMPRCATRRFR